MDRVGGKLLSVIRFNVGLTSRPSARIGGQLCLEGELWISHQEGALSLTRGSFQWERADKEEGNFAEFVWSMAKKLVCPPVK